MQVFAFRLAIDRHPTERTARLCERRVSRVRAAFSCHMATAGDVENRRQAGETETSSEGTHTSRTKGAPLGMFRGFAVYIYCYMLTVTNSFHFRTGV